MMLQIPMSKKAIAEAIGVDKSTVYREIKRNCDARSGSYSMELAQRKADRRKAVAYRFMPIALPHEMRNLTGNCKDWLFK